MKILLTVFLIAVSHLPFQEPPIRLNFTPESEKFVEATKLYQDLWQAEGRKMIEAMEAVSGLRFTDKEISAIVFEGASSSGYREKPMKMRASYPEDVKKATLIHELGHRLIAQLKYTPSDLDEHRILFLYLYEVWTKLYGKDFADRMVEIEKKRKGIYDYESAWNWALQLTEQERATRFREIVQSNSSKPQPE
jgi:hypothetical protein